MSLRITTMFFSPNIVLNMLSHTFFLTVHHVQCVSNQQMLSHANAYHKVTTISSKIKCGVRKFNHSINFNYMNVTCWGLMWELCCSHNSIKISCSSKVCSIIDFTHRAKYIGSSYLPCGTCPITYHVLQQLTMGLRMHKSLIQKRGIKSIKFDQGQRRQRLTRSWIATIKTWTMRMIMKVTYQCSSFSHHGDEQDHLYHVMVSHLPIEPLLPFFWPLQKSIANTCGVAYMCFDHPLKATQFFLCGCYF